MNVRLEVNEVPLVLHLIPSALGRGAQRAARTLVDELDESGLIRHRLLTLFVGPQEVEVDLTLRHNAPGYSAEGFDLRVARALRTELERLNPAVVVAHGGDPMKYAVAATIGTGRSLVYCVIGTYAGPPSPRHEWIWKRLMNRADLMVAVGDEVRDECTGRFGVAAHRAIVIPNGRDPTVFHPRSLVAETSATLIFVGALTAQKQPDRFIEVVRRLRAEGHSFRAMLVGDGPLARPLAVSAADNRVEVLGARSDVPDLLRQADVLLFTSLPAGEGMPGVFIEAGLSGLAVVSTPVPGADAVLAHDRTGLIVDDDVDALAAAVGQLLNDPARRTAMGAAARYRCESEFSLDLMAQRWRTALQPLVRTQGGVGGRIVRACRGGLARTASAFRRAMRARRGSSHS
jgi:glycosyltransferase involved in cell wall biosynthesis